MLILGQNDLFCGHSVVNFSVWFPQKTVLVANHVTEPGLLLTESGAVIKFSHFSSHPSACMLLNKTNVCIIIIFYALFCIIWTHANMHLIISSSWRIMVDISVCTIASWLWFIELPCGYDKCWISLCSVTLATIKYTLNIELLTSKYYTKWYFTCHDYALVKLKFYGPSHICYDSYCYCSFQSLENVIITHKTS